MSQVLLLTVWLCFLCLSLRVGPAVHDDAPPSATHGFASCVCSHGDVTDESPQYHCKHGSCSPADTYSRTPCTCHQGNKHLTVLKQQKTPVGSLRNSIQNVFIGSRNIFIILIGVAGYPAGWKVRESQ